MKDIHWLFIGTLCPGLQDCEGTLCPELNGCAAFMSCPSRLCRSYFLAFKVVRSKGTLSSAPDYNGFFLQFTVGLHSTAGPGGQRRGIGALRVKARDRSPPTQPNPEPRPLQDYDGQQGMLPQRNPPAKAPAPQQCPRHPVSLGSSWFIVRSKVSIIFSIISQVQKSMQSYQVSVLFSKPFSHTYTHKVSRIFSGRSPAKKIILFHRACFPSQYSCHVLCKASQIVSLC